MKKTGTSHTFSNFRTDWRIWITATVVIGAIAGLLIGIFFPRGPVTGTQTAVFIGAVFLTGVAGGFLSRSRWSMLITPVSFFIAFELVRINVSGPTVDGLHLGSMYGTIAFATGRLFTGALVILSMLPGTVYGRYLASRFSTGTVSRDSRPGAAGWSITVVVTIIVILLGVMLAWPGSTSPIIDVNGDTLPGSIAELSSIRLGGHEQAVMIRGRSTDYPVLLHLAGGPGGTDLGAMRNDTGLEQDFIVVTWEQRGAGKSYAALDPGDTLTLEQMIRDTIELTNYLRNRFDEDKIYLTGNSWGTTLGILAVQQHPELYHAFIGTGQMVSQRETDIMFYEDTLAWAEKRGDDALVNTLLKNGPPPYDSIIDYEPALSHEHDWNPYPYLDTSKEMPANLFVQENSWMDRINGLRSFLDTFSVLYPQLQEMDFREDVSELDVPYYMIIGTYEARGRAVLAEEWFEMLRAPVKEKFVFERSGHRPGFEEPARFAEVMRQILADTYPVD